MMYDSVLGLSNLALVHVCGLYLDGVQIIQYDGWYMYHPCTCMWV